MSACWKAYSKPTSHSVVGAMCLVLSAGSCVYAQDQNAQDDTQSLQSSPEQSHGDTATEDSVPFTVVPERNFGYVIGDVIEQRVQLSDIAAGLDLTRLEADSRVSTWLQRQSVSLTPQRDGNYLLDLRYQIVNSPDTIVGAALPELQLTLASDAASNEATQPFIFVDAWPFSLGPLTASVPARDTPLDSSGKAQLAGITLRDDRVLPELDTHTSAARMRAALWALALVLVAWGGWSIWRQRRDRIVLPFTRAAHALRGWRGNRSKVSDSDQVWKTLHHAFNETAGYAVNGTSVGSMLASHTWMQPLAGSIHAFFEASAARHFALPATDEPFAVVELAQALSTIERRNS